MTATNQLPVEEKKTAPRQELQWANDISYNDTNRRLHHVNVLEYNETMAERTTRFKHRANTPVTKDVPELSAGDLFDRKSRMKASTSRRIRASTWSTHTAYMPPYGRFLYLLLQIASIIKQLLRKSNLLSKELIKSAKLRKNFAPKLLKALRNFTLDVDIYRNHDPFSENFGLTIWKLRAISVLNSSA
jgi:hypothetical protein